MDYFAVILSIIFQCLGTVVSDKLIAVTAVVNHGDTIPARFYPTDPYQNPNFWNKPLGQLSNLGQQKSFEVGNWMRKRYDTKAPIITLHYNASQIYTYSEDRDQSLMSGECVMAGLYPPVGDEIWNRHIDWRPTPVHTAPLFLDYAIGRGVYCPRYEEELKKINHGRFLRTRNQEDKVLLDYLTLNTGEKFKNIEQIPALYDILTVEKDHGLTLPTWTRSIYPQALGKAVLQDSILRTKNPDITRLSIGPFLHLILKQFNGVVTNNSEVGSTSFDMRKFKLYITNNTIIYDTLHGLKVHPVGVVPFSASLIFELWKSNDGNNYVKLLYKKSPEPIDRIQYLKIGGCKSLKCPYSNFHSALHHIALNQTQWKEMCNQTILNPINKNHVQVIYNVMNPVNNTL